MTPTVNKDLLARIEANEKRAAGEDTPLHIPEDVDALIRDWRFQAIRVNALQAQNRRLRDRLGVSR